MCEPRRVGRRNNEGEPQRGGTKTTTATKQNKSAEKVPLLRCYFFLPFFLAGAGFFVAAFFAAGFLAAGLAGAFAGVGFAGVDFNAAAFFASAGGAPFCLAAGAGCFAGAVADGGTPASVAGAGAGVAAPASAFLGLRPRFLGA